MAAFGDSANVFGRVTNTSGFAPYVGEDFALLLPAKWNPSKERDFKGVKLRFVCRNDLKLGELSDQRKVDVHKDMTEPSRSEIHQSLSVIWPSVTASQLGRHMISDRHVEQIHTRRDLSTRGGIRQTHCEQLPVR